MMRSEEEGRSIDRREAVTMMLALGGLMAVPEPGSGGAHITSDTPVPDIPGSAPEDVFDAIDDVLKRTREIWNSQDFARLKEVWDADDPEPWYVPEEIETPFFSWPQIEKYWNPGRKVLTGFRWDYSNLRVKQLAPDLALALFDHFYEIELIFGPQDPTAGFDRVLTLFRKTPEGWRHILYAQCPLGPETYVRALRKTIVRPDFESFRDNLK
jgi:hypothetical protein